MNRLIGLIRGILPFFAAILLQYSLITLLDIAFNTSSDIHGWDITAYDKGVMVVFLCGLFFFFWYRNTVNIRRLELPGQVFRLGSILLLGCMGIATQFAVSGMMSFLQPVFRQLFEDYSQVVDSILSHKLPVVLLYVLLIAPLAEELIFRGVIMAKLREDLPFYGANLIQAALFGIYHWNIIQGIYAFGLGLLLGLAAMRFRSLTASVLLHTAINGASFLVRLLPNTITVVLLSTLAGALTLVGSIYLLYRRTTVSSPDE